MFSEISHLPATIAKRDISWAVDTTGFKDTTGPSDDPIRTRILRGGSISLCATSDASNFGNDPGCGAREAVALRDGPDP